MYVKVVYVLEGEKESVSDEFEDPEEGEKIFVLQSPNSSLYFCSISHSFSFL